MLKYLSYIKEALQNEGTKYKRGDKVIFNPSPNRNYYNIHKGTECEIIYAYQKNDNDSEQEYSVKTPKIAGLLALESELTPVTSNKTMDYIEKQFTPPPLPPKKDTQSSYLDPSKTKSENDIINGNIPVGIKVSVTGKQGNIDYKEKTGIVKKSAGTSYLIEFDEDESKNQTSYASLIDKELVTPLEAFDLPKSTKVDHFDEGNKVKCIDKDSYHFNQVGIVTKYWDDDNTYMVSFRDQNNSLTEMFMKFDQLELVNVNKKIEFEAPFEKKPVEVKNPSKVTEEEEDEDEVTNVAPVTFKKEDLVDYSYEDFLLKEKISTHEDLLALKAKYEGELSNPKISKLKKTFIERSLGTIDVIESYFQFLINKVSKDLPVLRTVEQIEDKDLLRTKTKVRASDSKELTRKYSFDQGIIAYWKFKDAVVFRTI